MNTETKKKELTKRETQVYTLIKEGLSNIDIAQNLGLSVNTIKTHVKNIYKKLNVKNRIHAILMG